MRVLNSYIEDKSIFDLTNGSLNVELGQKDEMSSLKIHFYGNDLIRLMTVMEIEPKLIESYQRYRELSIMKRSWIKSSSKLEDLKNVKVSEDEKSDFFDFHYDFANLRDIEAKEKTKETVSYELNGLKKSNEEDVETLVRMIDLFKEEWFTKLEKQIPLDNVWLDKTCPELEINKDEIVLNKDLNIKLSKENTQKLFDTVREHLTLGVAKIIEKNLPSLEKENENINKFITYLKDEEYKKVDFTDEDETFEFLKLQISVVKTLNIWN